jgi:hypothetical protein
MKTCQTVDRGKIFYYRGGLDSGLVVSTSDEHGGARNQKEAINELERFQDTLVFRRCCCNP